MGIHCLHYAPEKGKNPYMGFTSFQHFNGGKCYADIVVRPEAGMTETEPVEVYPISADAVETETGYYPSSTVAYIRILWKDYEPEKGKYCNDFVKQILDEAEAHGQTVMFRLMAHSTREQDDVPEWLKKEIDCPARPQGMRMKDSPTDPKFIHYFADAVRALGAAFDADPRMNAVDICLPGSWGEGHKIELYSEELLHEWMDAFIESFPHTHLIAQFAQPQLAAYCMEKRPVGLRSDGIGLPSITYARGVENQARYHTEAWKKEPIAIESYWWLGEWMRKGWDIEQIFELLLSWHVSTFNAKSIAFPKELAPVVERFESRMGYHFLPLYSALPDTACPGETIQLDLSVMNRGVAPLYEDLPVTLRIRNDAGSFVTELPINMRTWLPGAHAEHCPVTLPADLEEGEYQVEIRCGGLYLCTDLPCEDGYYLLDHLKVTR